MRHGLGLFLLTCLIFTSCLTGNFSQVIAEENKNSRPNLLIIQTDEHHYGTLGCYGSTMFAGEGSLTPNLDRIAAEGAIATSFYATTPVCSPSRSSLMSGRYPQSTPVEQNDIAMSGQITTFADVLKNAGYSTGYSGKWHLDGNGKPDWAPTRNFGWSDNRYMFNRGHWKKLVLNEDGPAVGSKNNRGQLNYNLDGADEKTFTTDWLIDRTLEFIEENADQSFCYMVSLPDPHGPNSVRAPYDTMYSEKDVVIPESLKKNRSQIPMWGQPERNVNEYTLKKTMPEYFGMVKCIDDNIGRLLQRLEEKELLDNTIVIFTSDHGDLCGEHGKLNKGNPYEGSARVPFLIRYPSAIPAGTKVDIALSCVDFFPTILKLMNVEATVETAGRDASAWLQGKKPEDWEDVAFLRSTRSNPLWLCAVSDQYKLVYSSYDRPWLFDLSEDPNELNNRFNDPAYAKVKVELSKALKNYGETFDDSYLNNSRIRYYLLQNSKSPEIARLEFRLGEKEAGPNLVAKSLPNLPNDRIYLHQEPVLENEHIAGATKSNQDVGDAIEVTFTKEGAEIMQKVTAENNGKRLAILVDDKLIMAPYIRSEISSKALITGTFTNAEIERLLFSLNAPAE